MLNIIKYNIYIWYTHKGTCIAKNVSWPLKNLLFQYDIFWPIHDIHFSTHPMYPAPGFGLCHQGIFLIVVFCLYLEEWPPWKTALRFHVNGPGVVSLQFVKQFTLVGCSHLKKKHPKKTRLCNENLSFFHQNFPLFRCCVDVPNLPNFRLNDPTDPTRKPPKPEALADWRIIRVAPFGGTLASLTLGLKTLPKKEWNSRNFVCE